MRLALKIFLFTIRLFPVILVLAPVLMYTIICEWIKGSNFNWIEKDGSDILILIINTGILHLQEE